MIKVDTHTHTHTHREPHNEILYMKQGHNWGMILNYLNWIPYILIEATHFAKYQVLYIYKLQIQGPNPSTINFQQQQKLVMHIKGMVISFK